LEKKNHRQRRICFSSGIPDTEVFDLFFLNFLASRTLDRVKFIRLSRIEKKMLASGRFVPNDSAEEHVSGHGGEDSIVDPLLRQALCMNDEFLHSVTSAPSGDESRPLSSSQYGTDTKETLMRENFKDSNFQNYFFQF